MIIVGAEVGEEEQHRTAVWGVNPLAAAASTGCKPAPELASVPCWLGRLWVWGSVVLWVEAGGLGVVHDIRDNRSLVDQRGDASEVHHQEVLPSDRLVDDPGEHSYP